MSAERVMDTNDLRRCGHAVYLVVEERAAKDIQRHFEWAASEIERLRTALSYIAWFNPATTEATMARIALGDSADAIRLKAELARPTEG